MIIYLVVFHRSRRTLNGLLPRALTWLYEVSSTQVKVAMQSSSRSAAFLKLRLVMRYMAS